MDVIAERVLDIESPGQPEAKVIRVVIGKPEQAGVAWRVPYEIHGPDAGEIVERLAYGDDALQAMASLLYILPAEMLRYERRGRVTYRGEPGFRLAPLPDLHGPPPVPHPEPEEKPAHRAFLIAVCALVFAVMVASAHDVAHWWERAILSGAAYVFFALSIQFVIAPKRKR
jgi:hypothetical protein